MTQSSVVALPENVREFLASGLRFATIATTDPDGAPRQAVNLVRDPRISMAVADAEDGYRWVGLTGVTDAVTDQPTAQADIAAMARRYHADEPDEAERMIRDRFERQERISFHVHPLAIHDHRE